MSLAQKAAGGFAWTAAANIGARILTIISTFVLTRYLAPAVQGEVNLAYVLVSTAGAASALGVAQYIAANPKEGRDTAFHGSVLVLALGVLVCLGCVAVAEPVAGWLNVPGMVAYVPGMAAAHYLDRCGWVPRALLIKEMRFRMAGLRVGLGELAFAISSVAFAHAGSGGNAIVFGNLIRSAVGLLFLIVVTEWRDYLQPTRLTLATMGKLLRFGLPMTLAGLFAMGAMSWDNSYMGYRFGEATVGIYNQAYRLADLPASSVGDQINDVLVPAFARANDAKSRRRGFFRATSLMALVLFPMALGLAATAPTMVEVFYPKSYAGVAPFLIVLAILSVTRSLANLAGAFLQVVGRTRSFVVIDFVLVVTVLGFMSALARFGAVWASVGVGIAYVLMLVLTFNALRPDGIFLGAIGGVLWRPFVACLPMVGVVIGARFLLVPTGLPNAARLIVELTLGAATYIGAALLIAPKAARDMIELGRGVLRRRRGEDEDAATAPLPPQNPPAETEGDSAPLPTPSQTPSTEGDSAPLPTPSQKPPADLDAPPNSTPK